MTVERIRQTRGAVLSFLTVTVTTVRPPQATESLLLVTFVPEAPSDRLPPTDGTHVDGQQESIDASVVEQLKK